MPRTEKHASPPADRPGDIKRPDEQFLLLPADWAELRYHADSGWVVEREDAARPGLAADLQQRLEVVFLDISTDGDSPLAHGLFHLTAFVNQERCDSAELDDALRTLVHRASRGGAAGQSVTGQGFLLYGQLTVQGHPATAQPASRERGDETAPESGGKSLRDRATRAGIPSDLEVPEPAPGPTFEAIDAMIDRALQQPTAEFRAALASLEGKSLGSLEANQRIASQIQEITSRLGVALACPRPGCGHPAKIRCNKNGSVPTGIFQFDHVIDGRRTTHGAYQTLPALRLVEAPPDRRKRPADFSDLDDSGG